MYINIYKYYILVETISAMFETCVLILLLKEKTYNFKIILVLQVLISALLLYTIF